MIARPLRFDPVPEGAEELIGYEPRTLEFDPRNPAQAREFLSLYREAQATGARVLAVRSKRGKLSVWQEAVEFWRPPEPEGEGTVGKPPPHVLHPTLLPTINHQLPTINS